MGSGNPQILSAPGGETMRQTTKRFRGARTCSRSSITTPSLVWLGFHPPPGWRKHIEFFVYPLRFFVRHALSLCHAYKHQSLFARFRHENVGEQKWFWCRWIGEDCAPVFNFLRLPPTVDITKCRSPKNGKNWGFSPPEGDRIRDAPKSQNLPKIVVFVHRKPTEWTHSDEIWRLVCFSTPNVTLIGKRWPVKEPKKVKICQNLSFSATGSRHSEHIHMKFGM